MCARISLTTTAAEIADLFNLSDDRPLFPRFNIAPSQSIPVVRMTGGVRELAAMRWGLIPHSTPSGSRRGWTRTSRGPRSCCR